MIPLTDKSGLPLAWEAAAALVDTIPSVDERTPGVIPGEIGLDMSWFPTADHLPSWIGLALGNNQSGASVTRDVATEGNQLLSSIMAQAAWVAVRIQDTILKARYHRLVALRGKKRAIMAVAHSMVVSAWHIPTY